MAKKTVNVGPFGPFIYDDSQDKAISTEGDVEVGNIVTSGLSVNVRLVASNSSKQIVEVNDLTAFIIAGDNITVTDNADGTVDIDLDLLLKQLDSIDDADSPYSADTSAETNYIIADAGSGAITINLPAASTWTEKLIVVKKMDATNDVTITPDGAETIDGAASEVLSTQYETVTLISTGTEILMV